MSELFRRIANKIETKYVKAVIDTENVSITRLKKAKIKIEKRENLMAKTKAAMQEAENDILEFLPKVKHGTATIADIRKTIKATRVMLSRLGAQIMVTHTTQIHNIVPYLESTMNLIEAQTNKANEKGAAAIADKLCYATLCIMQERKVLDEILNIEKSSIETHKHQIEELTRYVFYGKEIQE